VKYLTLSKSRYENFEKKIIKKNGMSLLNRLISTTASISLFDKRSNSFNFINLLAAKKQ
jgi:hypothetical protein